jgi:hypothetical protein
VKSLRCMLCGRKEVWGLLSSMAWGRVENGRGSVEVCPECQRENADWRTEATTAHPVA